MGTLEQFPGVVPAPAVMHILGRFDRITLEAFLSVAIDLLDVMDGDTDAEADDRGGETVAIVSDPDLPPEEDEGDPDLEQTRDEDDWFDHGGNGPGCPVSDPGGAGEAEDDEEDDGDTGIEDDPLGCDPETDFGAEEIGEDDPAEEGVTPDYGIDQTDPLPGGFTIGSDRDAMRSHRKRIRRDKCLPVHRRWGDLYSNEARSSVEGYRLIEPPIAPTRRQLLKRKRGMPRRPRA